MSTQSSFVSPPPLRVIAHPPPRTSPRLSREVSSNARRRVRTHEAYPCVVGPHPASSSACSRSSHRRQRPPSPSSAHPPRMEIDHRAIREEYVRDMGDDGGEIFQFVPLVTCATTGHGRFGGRLHLVISGGTIVRMG